MNRQWRVCLDCETEWLENEVDGGACPDCGGPTVPTDPERAAACRLYTSRRHDIAALLDWLQLELDKHAEYGAKTGVDYGTCGALGHVRKGLIETLSFLAQRDEKDIEEALADATAGREQAERNNTQ